MSTISGSILTDIYSIIVSIYNLGCFSGYIVNFLMGNWLGRRRAMWFAMVWIIVGATLQTSAFSVPRLMIGRFVTGIGTGIETSTVPMYQAELADAKSRGRLVCSEPLLVGVGIVIAYFFDYGMSFVGGQIAWRLPIACQMVFAFVVIFLVFGLPESPRYCYQQGRNEEALQILCDIFGREPDHPKIQQEQAEILEAIAVETKHGQYKWRTIFKRDEVATGQRVLLAYGMQFMNQVSLFLLTKVVSGLLTAIDGWYQSRRVSQPSKLAVPLSNCWQLLHPNRARRQRGSHAEPLPHPRRLRADHVRYRELLPCLLCGPSRSTEAHDVGICWSRNLHDDGRYPSQLQRHG